MISYGDADGHHLIFKQGDDIFLMCKIESGPPLVVPQVFVGAKTRAQKSFCKPPQVLSAPKLARKKVLEAAAGFDPDVFTSPTATASLPPPRRKLSAPSASGAPPA